MEYFLVTTILLLLIVGAPILLIVCIRDLFGKNKRTRSSSAIGSTLLELDRLITRPSIVHQIEAQEQATSEEDNHGGE